MTDRRPAFDDPDAHQNRPLVTAGAPRGAAKAAVVLLHGRGATAEGIVATAEEFYKHGVAFLAPQAARYTWFPANASAPLEANEPWLTSAVEATANAVDAATSAGVPPERTIIFGFSQGACVAGEFAIRHPRRYGGLVLASGAIPGPPERDPDVPGTLDGTPISLACSDDDPDVDIDAIHRTATIFERANGRVMEAITTGVGHTITDDAIDAVTEMLDDALDSAPD